MAESRDGCVVDSEPLAGVLHGFVDSFNRGRHSTAGRFARGEGRRIETNRTLGPVEWLSDRTGVPERTISNILLRKEGRIAPKNRTTELRIADALLTAIGSPEAFHDGTLEIRPNPSAKRAVRDACCPGSLTGEA